MEYDFLTMHEKPFHCFFKFYGGKKWTYLENICHRFIF